MRTANWLNLLLFAGIVSFFEPAQVVAAPTKPQASAEQAALAEANELNSQASEKMRQKKFDEALVLAQKSLAIREKVAPDSVMVEVTLRRIAEIHENAGQHDRAVAPTERARDICIKRGVKGVELQMCHQYVGHACVRASRHDCAVAAFQEALSIGRDIDKGTDDEHTAMPLWSLSKSYSALRRYAEAESAISRVIAYYEQQQDQRGIEGPLFVLGELYYDQGFFGRAEPILVRAMDLKTRRFTRGHAMDIISKLALTRMALEDYDGARGLLDELILDAQMDGEDTLRHAVMLGLRGRLDIETGAYDLAEQRLDRARGIADKLLTKSPEQSAVVAAAVAGMRGRLASHKGDLVRAEKLLLQELEVAEKKYGAKDKTVAGAAAELAEVYRKAGQLDRADAFALRALTIRDEVLAPMHPNRAESRAVLGRIREERGDGVGAKKLHEEALALREQAFGKDHPSTGGSLLDLADLARRQGQIEVAEGYYKQVIAIFEKAFGPDHDKVASSVEGLAALYAGVGKLDVAIRLAERAADIRERQAALVIAAGSDAQKRAFIEKLRVGTDFVTYLHAQVAPSNETAKRLALTTIFQRKGRVLDVLAGSLSALRNRLSPADKVLFDEVAAARADVARLAMRGPAGDSLDLFRAELAKREEKARALEEKLGGQSDVYRSERIAVTIERIQALIPQSSALVEFTVYVPRRAADRLSLSRVGAPRIGAYVLDTTGKIEFVDLGEAAPIEQATYALRKALSSPKSADPKTPARALDELVMRKVRPLLGGKTKLLISADGVLSLVPFAAMVDEDGRYLLEQYEPTYLTSGRDLIRLARKTNAPVGPTDKLLVVANPAFGSKQQGESALALLAEPSAAGKDDRADRGIEKAFFPPLPATATEAKRISQLVPDAMVLMDVDATESAVKKVHAPRMLHIATHGFFVTNKAKTARDAAASQRALVLETSADWLPDDPLLRSGIALVGANSKQGGGAEDGILTALEASSLDLQGTKLVILSACETAIGDVMQGEGVYGLRRALFIAGTESLVASMWKVADEETQTLMVAYYRRLLEGQSRTEALRNVELAMLATPATAHPYYWASFSMFGNSEAMGAGADGLGESAGGVSKVLPVRPGARGCGCFVAEGDQDASHWVAVSIGLALAAARRRSARTFA